MILWLLKLTKPIFQVKLHKTTSLVTKVCSVSSNYSKWCKFQIRIIRVSRSWISLLLRQGFFCCRNSSLGESLEPLEGVVDEDPVLVAVPDLVRLVLAVAVVQVVVVHTGDPEVNLDKSKQSWYRYQKHNKTPWKTTIMIVRF